MTNDVKKTTANRTCGSYYTDCQVCRFFKTDTLQCRSYPQASENKTTATDRAYKFPVCGDQEQQS